MSLFSRKDEAIKQEGKINGFVKEPGVYDAEIVRCVIEKTKNGATTANFTFKFKESETEQTVYGLVLYNTKGDENPIGYGVYSSLLATLGIKDPGDPVKRKIQIKNKEGNMETVEKQVLASLSNKKVKVQIGVEYDLYQDIISEKIRVKRFYRFTDGASGGEILVNKDFGEDLKKDIERGFKPRYKNGLTEEQIVAWKKARAEARNRNGGANNQQNSGYSVEREAEERQQSGEETEITAWAD